VVRDGKLWIAGGRQELDQHIAKLDGREVDVIVRKHRQQRSLSQNAWYWGCIVPMIQEAAGFETSEETHEALKIHFLSVRTGALPTVRSTSSLDTAEMVEYCESCRRLAAKMWAIDIPDPKRAAEMGFAA
jgi:hypothetical protein